MSDQKPSATASVVPIDAGNKADQDAVLRHAETARSEGDLDNTQSMTHASRKLGVAETSSISPGTRIKQYEIIREVARGGMGVVYLARDTKLGRRVAVKVLHEHESDDSARVLIEARATALCIHENIVVIHEVDEYQGHPFMVLEYLSGRTLGTLLTGHPLPHARAIELIVPVVRALACAHAQGIVHRDLKPDNIVVTDAGAIKVLDFGIAKVLGHKDTSDPSRRSGSGSAAGHRGGADSNDGPRLGEDLVLYASDKGSLTGTLPYMSPEQWGSDEVDHRSDLWAVGIMLHVMLSGRHPLSPLSVDRLRQIADLSQPMPRLDDARLGVPAELARVVDACLIKNKKDRMASAGALLARLEPFLPYGRKLEADISPYAGLASFQESDAERFFGRSRDVAALVGRLRERPLVGVVGPSGIGKSSFVSAGVIPALKNSGEAWESLTIRPGRRPLVTLAHALASFATVDGVPEHDQDGDSAQEVMRARLAEEPGYAGALLRQRARRFGRKIVVFVDQFEEMYTLGSNPDERADFAACLLGMADDVATPLRVILAARSDFLDRAAEDRAFMSELTQGLWFLPPPDRAGLREALIQPAEMAGYRFESDKMIELLLDALEATRAALPLLQFTAAILWESRDRQHRLLTEDSYARIGGIAGALAEHADKVLAGLPTHLQQLARRVFRRLVTPERTRDVVAFDELCELSSSTSEVSQLVDYFADARLLVVHTGGDSEASHVEIIHESLIASWPTLGRWLDENQEAAAFLAELRAAARQWRAHGRSQGLLWRGEAEREARHWHQRCSNELSESESEFLVAVFALADRSARRKRQLIIGTMAFLSSLVAAAIIALVLIRNAEHMAKEEAARAREAERVARQQQKDLADNARRIQEQTKQIGTIQARNEEVTKQAEEAQSLNKLTRAELIGAVEQARKAQRDADAAKKQAEQQTGKANEAAAKARAAMELAQSAIAAEREANLKLQKALRDKENCKTTSDRITRDPLTSRPSDEL